MPISGVKSRPVYPDRLVPDPAGRWHVLAGLGEAALPVAADLLAQAADRSIIAPIHILLGAIEHRSTAALRLASPHPPEYFEHEQALLTAFEEYLDQARMGIRVYAAGPEAFLWAIDRVAARFGFGKGEVMKCPAGSRARTVYCCHCKTVNPGVVTNIYACSECGFVLEVRDHFSRRLGCFMGVKADAEVPGELPEALEAFS